MGDTSETNTKVLSRELFLGVVALKRLYQKIIICATRTLFSGTVTYDFLFHLINSVTMGTNQECMNTIIILSITFRLEKKVIHSSHNYSDCVLSQVCKLE